MYKTGRLFKTLEDGKTIVYIAHPEGRYIIGEEKEVLALIEDLDEAVGYLYDKE
jgi:hypothetical protein